MRAVLRFLGSRWFLTFIGAALIAVLVWLFGPFLTYLESWIARAEVIAAMVVIWGAVNFWLSRRRRKKERALVQGVTAAPIDPTIAASAEEAAAMQERLTTALAQLKKASGARGYLYEQPCRTQAAELGGVTLQVVRDWVLRFNADGPAGLIDRKAPGQTPGTGWMEAQPWTIMSIGLRGWAHGF